MRASLLAADINKDHPDAKSRQKADKKRRLTPGFFRRSAGFFRRSGLMV